MSRFILPTILIGIAISGFFILTKPTYENITSAREQIASYDEALANSKALEAERDKLTQKSNSFKEEELARLHKLLPDNVDNIRLILEIEKIAAPYGMVLKDVKYDTTKKDSTETNQIYNQENPTLNKDYGIWDLEFSTQATYNNFVSFIKDLENNLRIVDISSVQFAASGNTGLNPALPEAFKYTFRIKTYWLKN
ncbi:MAG: hypothetical protein NDI62_01345 [Burkholderiales bacterium]|nr:hypothetical protein [Burkholderiales bacterium]